MQLSKKILVVEDFAESQALLVLCLEHAGYAVLTADDGIEALEKAFLVRPDLILMDISMPRLDGIQATARLKDDPKTREIPVVITTAHTQKSLIERAIQSGALDVLIKPLNFIALAKLLDVYLSTQNNMTSSIDSRSSSLISATT